MKKNPKTAPQSAKAPKAPKAARLTGVPQASGEHLSQTLQTARELPIGVFDSGVGGLTVLRAIRERLPQERLLYLGDTARLPYGTKSPATVSRYALQAAGRLVERRIKLLVVACNTATASALEDLRAAWPKLPVLGVIEPGAMAACAASHSGHIAVIATESTIRNQAYQKAIARIKPDARISGQPCSLFVSLAEEGWVDGDVAEAVARRYLTPLFSAGPEQGPDCLVLGCTHFPPLAGAIRKVVGNGPAIVDSAATTAQAVAHELARLQLLREGADQPVPHFMTTDDTTRFARIGRLFLGQDIDEGNVELVNL